MTFLSPVYLWFLPLVAAPVIIHLLAKRKSRLIEFPSLIFLKRLEQDALKKFNIKQLILLIIRTLLILLIILAFARPTLNSGPGFGIHFQNTDLLVIVLDNTASTRATYTDLVGSWLGELKDEMSKRGSQVLYCSANDFRLHNDYQDINPSYSGIAMDPFMVSLQAQHDIDRYRKISVLWIGDGQDLEEKLIEYPEIEVFTLIKNVTDDSAVLSMKLPERSLLHEETYSVASFIGSSRDDSEIAVELSVNEKRVNQAIISDKSNYLELSARVLESGYQEGMVKIQEDSEAYNDARHFVLRAGQELPVQIISANRSPNFWQLAEKALEDLTINLDFSIISINDVDQLNTSVGGSIIVDDASQIQNYVWDQLELFLKRGGQLILFGDGGERMQQILGLNHQLVQEVSDVAFALKLSPSNEQAVQSLPFQDLLSQNRIKVYQRYNTAGGELDETWIRYLDDEPFMAKKDLHSGRIIWVNTNFTLEGTNLPLLGIFPTLIHKLGQYQTAETNIQSRDLQIGDTLLFIPTSTSDNDLLFSVQRPDGTIDFQQPDSNFIIQYNRTDIPGVYRFQQGREVLSSVAVNVSSDEAAAHLSKRELPAQFKVFEELAPLRAAVLNRSTGIALWPVLLVIIGLLWVAEIILSRIRSTWRTND